MLTNIREVNTKRYYIIFQGKWSHLVVKITMQKKRL